MKRLPEKIPRIVFEIDREIVKLDQKLKLLYYINPINSEEEQRKFFEEKGSCDPRFRYKPLAFDPQKMGADLASLPLAKIRDPNLHHIYAHKRIEMCAKIDLLIARDTPDFLRISRGLFFPPYPRAVLDAEALLSLHPLPEQRTLSPKRVKGKLEEYVALLQRKEPRFKCDILIKDHLSSNAAAGDQAVSIKKSAHYSLAEARMLMVHEVGIHVATSVNGFRQPLKIFGVGLPGYIETQEGLAIFAEFQAKLLTTNRLRTIAARAIAIHLMCEGATFTQVYRQMTEKHHFSEKDAFAICERAFRSGGYTKDSLYQLGFTKVFHSWIKGASMQHLLAGKFHLQHLPMIHRFAEKGWLHPPAVIPPFLSNLNRLEAERHVITILNHGEYLREEAGLFTKT